MYPGKYATERAGHPAFIMASTGEKVTYAELEARSNRLVREGPRFEDFIATVVSHAADVAAAGPLDVADADGNVVEHRILPY